jgi:hypothetical protein
MDDPFLTRERLLADLDAAVGSEERLRLYFVFRLAGIDRLHDLVGDAVAEVLLIEAATSIAQVIGPRATYYRPRRDELCGLVVGDDLLGIEETLVSVLGSLNAEHAAVGLHAGLGAIILPREARTAADAIALADQRVVGVSDRKTPVLRGGSTRGRLYTRAAQAA